MLSFFLVSSSLWCLAATAQQSFDIDSDTRLGAGGWGGRGTFGNNILSRYNHRISKFLGALLLLYATGNEILYVPRFQWGRKRIQRKHFTASYLSISRFWRFRKQKMRISDVGSVLLLRLPTLFWYNFSPTPHPLPNKVKSASSPWTNHLDSG